MVGGSHDPGQGALPEAKPFEQLGPLAHIEPGRLRLELDADPEDLRRLTELALDRLHQPLGVGDLIVAQVDDGEDGLVGEQEERPQGGPLVVAERRTVDGHTGVELTESRFEGGHLTHQRAIGPGRLAALVELGLDGGGVGEHQLQLEGVQIGERVGAPYDVGVLEGPQHHDHGAQALARRRSRHQGGDVDELDRGGDDLLGPAQLPQGGQPVVGDLGHAHIRLGRGERMGRHRRLGAGEGVEQG